MKFYKNKETGKVMTWGEMTKEAERLYNLKDSTDPLEWGEHYTEVDMTEHDLRVQKVIDWFSENDDAFTDVIEELDSYNGYLSDDRYWNMYDIDEVFCMHVPSEILRLAFYGHDEDTWSTDGSGNKIYGEFNPNREYFRFNGYGNLVSSDYKDYSAYLDKYFVKELIEQRQYIYMPTLPDEITKILDELEEEENA